MNGMWAVASLLSPLFSLQIWHYWHYSSIPVSQESVPFTLVISSALVPEVANGLYHVLDSGITKIPL